MKILFVSYGNAKHGGADVVMRDLVLSVRQHGIEPQCLFGRHGPLVDEFNSLGIKTYRSPYRGWLCYQQDVIYKMADFYINGHVGIEIISKILLEEKIDLVITNTLMIMDAALAAHACSIPHIWYVHELISEDPDLEALCSINLSHYYPLVFMLSKAVIAISHAVRTELECFTSVDAHKKIRVVYNGIEVKDENAPVRQHNKVVLAAGSICPRKGFGSLINAAPYVLEEVPDARFIIAGRSHKVYSQQLDEAISRYGLQGKVRLIRYCDDMPKLYSESSVFVMCSVCEPFGLVVLEAMRAGLPVISTRCGGPQEILTDNVTGVFTSPDGLAGAIIKVLKDEELGDKIGRAAFGHVKTTFTHEKFIDGFLNAIRD